MANPLWLSGCFQQPLLPTTIQKCLSYPASRPPSRYVRPSLSRSDPSPRAPPVPTRRQVLFVGDSNVRLLYFAAVRKIDGGRTVSAGWETDGSKHSDRKVTIESATSDGGSLDVEFWWYVSRARACLRLTD